MKFIEKKNVCSIRIDAGQHWNLWFLTSWSVVNEGVRKFEINKGQLSTLPIEARSSKPITIINARSLPLNPASKHREHWRLEFYACLGADGVGLLAGITVTIEPDGSLTFAEVGDVSCVDRPGSIKVEIVSSEPV